MGLELVTPPKPDLGAIRATEDALDPWYGETIPLEAVPEPDRFHIIVKQVGIKKKVGSIVIPDTVQADQTWTHGMAIVVKVGKAVYRGSKFADMGLSPEDAPKPCDLVFFESRAPRKFKLDGEVYMVIPDDAVIGRFDRAHVHRISFTI